MNLDVEARAQDVRQRIRAGTFELQAGEISRAEYDRRYARAFGGQQESVGEAFRNLSRAILRALRSKP